MYRYIDTDIEAVACVRHYVDLTYYMKNHCTRGILRKGIFVIVLLKAVLT